MGSPSIRYRFVVALFLIVVTALISYSHTFSSPFQFDDIPNIVEGSKIQDLSNLVDLSGTRYAGELSFALNYHFGGLNVFGYHLVNILIHIINGILVWWLVVLTLRTPVMAKVSVEAPLRDFIPLASALIFVAHPVQTQAVTYIVQRFASLAALFYLLSLVLFVRWRLSAGSRYHVIFYPLSILSALLAMKTKEISFTLPFLVLLCEYSFWGARKKRAYYLIPILLTLLIIPFAIIDMDKPVGDILGELREVSQETGKISRGDYLLTQFRVIVTYIRLLFIPVDQNLDYDYPIYHSFFAPEVFLSFLFLLSVFSLAVYLFIRSRKGGNGYFLLSSFGIFWFFITLSVESSVIPIKDVIFEHRLYLPGAGAVIAFSSGAAYGLEYAGKRSGIRFSYLSAASIFLIITVLPLSAATWQRNRVWKDEITLWQDVIRKSPGKARGYDNLGVAYYQQGRIDEAIEKYRIGLRLAPGNHNIHYDLGVALNKQGRLDEAIEEFKTALRLEPNIAEVHYNLGLVYFRHGKMDEAIEAYREALRLKHDHAGIHHDLGVAYARQGRIDEAIEEYKTALKLNPDFSEAYNNLGVVYVSKGLIGEAIGRFKTALRLKPDYAEAQNNLRLLSREMELRRKGR